jgi:hypothetical protein
MEGTLTIRGDLTLLGRLALKIDEWFPGALATEVGVLEWGGWSVETMAMLVDRLHPVQRKLIGFVADADGQRTDDEVRAEFAGDHGLKGLTGPLSRHIERMQTAGVIPTGASFVVMVDRTPRIPVFRMPEQLVPVVKAALRRAA